MSDYVVIYEQAEDGAGQRGSEALASRPSVHCAPEISPLGLVEVDRDHAHDARTPPLFRAGRGF